MHDPQQDDAPRLVTAGQGASALHTIQYKGRFLYSKYDPARAITRTVQGLAVLPGTLFVLCSPGLWYGLDALMERLDTQSAVVAVEADDALRAISQDALPDTQRSRMRLFGRADIMALDQYVRTELEHGRFRRAVRIDFCAGVQFAPDFYAAVCDGTEELIAAFWKNRLTLTRLGRLFSRNVLRNVAAVPQGATLNDARRMVSRPILVCGAGESLDHTLNVLGGDAKGLFVLAVDAALPCLATAGVVPDAAVGMESQLAIEQAYIGLGGIKAPIFLDLASRPQVAGRLGGKVIWFCSHYADAAFLERVEQELMPGSVIPPLGSVGLCALYVALVLRRDQSVPVFVTGLDFSYSAGRTHAQNTHAHKASLATCGRLGGCGQYGAAFGGAAVAVTGKDGRAMHTTPNMLRYAQVFRAQFAGAAAVYDTGRTGIDLGLPQAPDDALERLAHAAASPAPAPLAPGATGSVPPQAARQFCNEQYQALVALRDLLVHGTGSAYYKPETSLTAQIEALLHGREYLYLHFPDGYAPNTTPAFLNRVRAEIEPFMRVLRGGACIQH